MNCSFLHSSVSLQRLAGFAGRFYDFPNDIGPLFHRASSQSIKGIHTLKETNHNPHKTTGKQLESISAPADGSCTVARSQDDQEAVEDLG